MMCPLSLYFAEPASEQSASELSYVSYAIALRLSEETITVKSGRSHVGGQAAARRILLPIDCVGAESRITTPPSDC